MSARRELPIEAFVLAGGRSRRMGRDKALLEWGGSRLVERAVQSLRGVCALVRIVGDREDLNRLAPVVADTFPGSGPLGGIHAALAATTHDWNLFLPVDMPLLPAGFPAWMLDRVALTEAVATMPVVAGLPQPLCAVYHRAMEPALREELTAGRLRTIEGVQSAASRAHSTEPRIDTFHVESLAAAGNFRGIAAPLPVQLWFENVNNPRDFLAIGTA
jgi:molybdopterin-guanine dinucleotide biosynthesis protein A